MRFPWSKKQKSRNELFEFDLNSIASLPLLAAMDKKQPFDIIFDESQLAGWCIPIYPVNQDHITLIQMTVMGYEWVLYLDCIRQRYGAEVASIVKAHIQVMGDRAPQLEIRNLLEIMDEVTKRAKLTYVGLSPVEKQFHPLELYIAYGSLFFIPGAPLFEFRHLRSREANFDAESFWQEHAPTDGLDVNLASCLIAVRNYALPFFLSWVERLNLSSEAIAYFQIEPLVPDIDHTYSWSPEPGCFERHLQRRLNNPIFPKHRRSVLPTEIVEARWRDCVEKEHLKKGVLALVETMIEGPSIVSGHDAIDSMRKAVPLIKRSYELGGNIKDSINMLWQYYDLYYKCIEEYISKLIGGEDGVRNLQEASCLEKEGLRLVEGVVGQFFRSDGPISNEDILPALLCEDIDAINRFIKASGAESILKQICHEGWVLIGERESEGFMLADVREKLSGIESSIYNEGE